MKRIPKTNDAFLKIEAFRAFMVQVLTNERFKRTTGNFSVRLPGDNRPIVFKEFGTRVFSSGTKDSLLAVGKYRKNNSGDVLLSAEDLDFSFSEVDRYEVLTERNLEDEVVSDWMKRSNTERAIAFVRAVNILNETDTVFRYIIPGFDFLLFLQNNQALAESLKLTGAIGIYLALGDLFYFKKDVICAGCISTVNAYRAGSPTFETGFSVLADNTDRHPVSERVTSFDHFLLLKIPR